jgi:hypothetical protein
LEDFEPERDMILFKFAQALEKGLLAILLRKSLRNIGGNREPSYIGGYNIYPGAR